VKVKKGGDKLRYEGFAVRDAVTAETERLREIRDGGDPDDRRVLRQAEKRVSKAKRNLRRVY
jgi:hypothetical protein